MDDGALAQFTSITGTQPETAQRYLAFTDGDLQQAIELFFANDGADLDVPSASDPPASSRPPPVPPSATRPPPEQHAVQIDSDSDSDEYPTTRRSGSTGRQPEGVNRAQPFSHQSSSSKPSTKTTGGGVNDDEAFARQLQQEMYGEAGVESATGLEGVRAPIARTTETLVGPDSFDPNDPADMNAAVLEQLRSRQRPRPRGTFVLAAVDHALINLTLYQIDLAFSTKPRQTQYGMKIVLALLILATDLRELLLERQKCHPSRGHWPRCTDRHMN